MTDTGMPARQAALAIVSGVLRRRWVLDFQLEELRDLSPRDAGFARALASETLRHLGALDAVLRSFLQKPPAPHKSGAASEILLLGTCELLILKVAPHAAVDAANQLATADPKAVHFKPLVNAVLRRIAREGADVMANLDQVRLCTPDWLWARWTMQYGEAQARAIARSHLNRASLDIVLKPAAALPDQSHALFGQVGRLSGEGRIEERPGFREGNWWVQDAAASLPALLLGDVSGMKVIDLCAAPGGKTMQLAAAGADVIAVEIDAGRASRLRENLARTKLKVEVVQADARDFHTRAAHVLIDAPCTATGTIRRHPDLPWIKTAADVTNSAAAAYEILESGAALVEPAGTLVFAVCSLEREEGEEQIAAFLAAHPEFERQPVRSEELFGHSEWITPTGDMRTLPNHLQEEGGMDGFYAARLRRR
jgi:16S rRNA (cytosine967-C5)-methyltransferase